MATETTLVPDNGPINARNSPIAPDSDMLMIQAELHNASQWSDYVPTPDVEGVMASHLNYPDADCEVYTTGILRPMDETTAPLIAKIA
ncbi:hypothetical protein FN846DRAFT_903439 [Sphaerosporella brunnea]|uniref:Uncharacterized protein n=1 Tax=Sphaerosporella brunnea TaxID=1250544 RepID=A0A5J5F7G0_9PEZI|nr:hypothetical protein FN846DRAFT_903439 [Sphaerosporella brunnea]